ncbi:MAG TPA: ribbon-helix-helix protein, CopG family [Stellaceae bacterium]|nr:ribbon-helix-helix protein, CopG family [Stellaceae bacterium]
MSNDVAIEARIPVELDDALARLASSRGKTKSRLVREVLAEFVLSEKAFAAAVAEGRAAADADDLIDHDEVMRQIDELLAKQK